MPAAASLELSQAGHSQDGLNLAQGVAMLPGSHSSDPTDGIGDGRSCLRVPGSRHQGHSWLPGCCRLATVASMSLMEGEDQPFCPQRGILPIPNHRAKGMCLVPQALAPTCTMSCCFPAHKTTSF